MHRQRFGNHEGREHLRERRMKVLVWVLSFVMVVFGISRVYVLFTVQHIHCLLMTDACDPPTEHIVETLLHKSMFSHLTLPSDIQATIQRQWPNTLQVQVSQGAILVTLDPSSSVSSALAITINGEIRPPKQATRPIGISDLEVEKLHSGDHVDTERIETYRELLHFLSTEHTVGLRHITIVSRDEIRFAYDQGLTVVFDASTLTDRLRSLQVLLQTPTIDKAGRTIDMRFRSPVIQ